MPPEPLATESAAAAGRGSVRVLVVDDEAAIRLLCRVNLEASGLDVLEAADGRAAVAAVREHRPDLVLLDVMMPVLNGWDVAHELAGEEASPPIVFLTALADASARVKAYEHGGVGYVLKPFDPVSLSAYVGATLDRLQQGEGETLRRHILEGTGDLHAGP